MSTSDLGYLKYYHLEHYLFQEVSSTFNKTKSISEMDFFCIVIWKANRSKSKIAKKLLKKGFSTYQAAISMLTKEIANAENDREKMGIMIQNWEFGLPMASAILSVFYPKNFTVYDIRVCDMLNDFHKIKNWTFEKMWPAYVDYVLQVQKTVKCVEDLRDKDKVLWGKSFYFDLQQDIAGKFKKRSKRSSRAFDA